MAKKDSSEDQEIEHIRSEPRPNFTAPLPRKQLPKELQATVDDEEKFWDALTSGRGEDSTESSIRYAAYASRFRTILLSAHRYVAYTSDIGESFRPIAHPNMVRFAYGISWAYLIGDVSNEGYKAYKRNQEILHPTAPEDSSQAAAPGKIVPIEHWGSVVAQRAVFQSIASMGLPAFTIHSVVRYSGQALKNNKNATLRTWGPIGLGLAVVPTLPFLFDTPVEVATEWVFHKGFELVGGPQAVGHKPESVTEMVKEKIKEKEL
ncbi:mitochondrial fission process protein 1 [Acrodontium crateriforme]|uniref:Mitochondrial fission process protein 1 n=1 Tax=Acrodontium crateriforme TaxID=150365 RepID=A0AAQ3M329_9PEZI|nr:mitochondrial fission process protein 1 [Acrodontium crateriforme]